MKRLFSVCLALSFVVPFTVGCEKKAEVKEETTVTTPGGSTTVTETQTIETSGGNPPAAK